VDTASSSGCAAAIQDQRLVNRPSPLPSGACDVGAVELVQGADLGVTAAVAPAVATAGEALTYSFKIASNSPPPTLFGWTDATQPVLTDVLPASLDYVSGSAGCSAAGKTVTCAPGSVHDEDTTTVTIVARATVPGAVTNRATIASPRPDANPADDGAGVDATVRPRAIGDAPPLTSANLAGLALSPARFRAARSGASVASRRTPVGTNVRYSLSRASAVLFTVQKRARGRLRGKRCVAGRKAPRRGRRCVSYRSVRPSFTHQGTAGEDSFRFSGRVGSSALRPGAYRLVGVPTSAPHGDAIRASFTIVRR
jgi:uncharacterized repeat protein (TIGR01451 family)